MLQNLPDNIRTVADPVKFRQEAQREGPRDAPYRLKSCQLPRNSAETTCTTSPEQVVVMKLQG